MQRFRLLLLFCVSTAAILAPNSGSFLSAQERVNYETLRISKILVDEDGGVSAQTRSLISGLKTKEGEYFSQTVFDADLKQLSTDFAQVVPKVQVVDGSVEIKLSLSKRPIIHSVTITGNSEYKTDKLLKELAIEDKTVFDRQTFMKAFNKLRAYYIKRGYFDAKLSYEQKPAKEHGQIDIIITINEGPCGKVDEIRFVNFTAKEQEELDDHLATKEYAWWHSWLTDTGYFNKERAQQDELGILSLLQNEGYADATVEAKVVPVTGKKDKVRVEFICNRGDLYTISNVTVEGNTLFTNKELLNAIGITDNAPYSPEALRNSARNVYELYGKKGYIDAMITPEGRLDRKTRSYSIAFRIQEGKQFRVGLIKIFGNIKTDASVILHETPLVPGEVFDTTLLIKTQERLQNVGYFQAVNVYAVRTSQLAAPGSTFRDIHIEVDEKGTTANFNAFIGYSRTEGVVGGAGINESNFRMAGIPRLFTDGFRALRGAGEYAGLNVQVGTKQLQYNATWTKPYFMDTKWILGVDLQKMRNSYAVSDYTINSETATVTLNYPVNAFVKVGGHYRIKNSEISLKGIDHDRRNRELIRESHNGGLISALGVNWNYDSTNHPVLPTQGLRSTVSLEYAGLGGDHRFFTFGYVNTLFWSPFEKGLFRFRGNVHMIKTVLGTHPRELPLAERLYMGGEQSMRGYRFNTVGPRFHDEKHTPRGGTSSVLLSAEYDYPIMKRLSAFVFLDAGNAYWRQLTIGRLFVTTGFGGKVKITETAPLIFGWGFPLHAQHKDDVQRFFFSIGTQF